MTGASGRCGSAFDWDGSGVPGAMAVPDAPTFRESAMARMTVLGGTFAATWMIAATAWAQSAQIQGRLADEQGGVLPGVQVSAIDEEKGVIARQVTSGADGFFNLVALLRGRYTVRAEISGFKTLERRGLVLDPGQVLDLGEVKLAVGALTETVDVMAASPVVEIGTSQDRKSTRLNSSHSSIS